jgi:hypothetical protein
MLHLLLLINFHASCVPAACKRPLPLPLPLLLLLQRRCMIRVVITAVITVSCKRLDAAARRNFLQEATWWQRLCQKGLWRAELAEAVAIV